MKKIKRIKGLFVVCLLMMALMVPVTGSKITVATSPDIVSPGDDDPFRVPQWLDDMQRLQAEIDRLQGLLNAQPTPTPVTAPLPHLVGPHNITIPAGETMDVTLTIRNIGTHTAFSLLSHATTTGPFVVEFLNNTNSMGSMTQASQRHMMLRIIVDPDIPSGNHTINITHRFRDAAGVNASSTDVLNVRVIGEDEEDEGAANIRIGNFRSSVSTPGADESFTVTADIQNTGDAVAENLQVSIANLDPAAVFLTSDLNQAFFAELEPGQTRQVSFTFRTARAIAANTYQLDFRLTYDGSAANRPATPFFINVVVPDQPTESPNIELRGMTVTSGRLAVGQTGQISFELLNTGDATAHNILVTATAMSETRLVPSTSNRHSVQALAVGGTQAFTFGFMPTPSSQTQSEPVRIEIQYEIRGEDEPFRFIQYVALNVYNPEPEEDDDDDDDGPERTQIPRIMVSAYTITPQITRAGQNFEMEITFLNTSGVRSVNNVLVTFIADSEEQGAVFTPVGGSNTLFIDFLAPGESVTRTVTKFTIPDALPRIYTLAVNFEYQDEDYFEHDATVLLSIPVAQVSRLETYPPMLNINNFMDMWGFVDVEFNVLNTGRVDLYNVWVRVDGPFDLSDANVFMSTLGVGRTNTYRGRIRPAEPGTHTGTITVSGEDNAGAIIEVVHEFTIEVMDAGDFEGGFGDEFGDDMWFEGGGDRMPGFGDFDEWGEDGEGGIVARVMGFVRRPIFWGPLAGVAAAGIIALVVYIQRRRARLFFEDDGGN